MKKRITGLVFLLLTVVLLATALLTSCNCAGGTPDDPTPTPEESDRFLNPRAGDATLLNGMDNMQDLYALKPMDVTPYDAYRMTLNEDPAYIRAGEGSFRYEFEAGSSHTFLQLLAASYHADLAVRELKAASVEVFNASESVQQVTISVTTAGGAALFSRTVTAEPGAWTTVSYDGLEAYTYKKKTAVGGVAFRFDAESAATLYVDEMRVELGAADLPSVDFNAYVASIADIAPASPLDAATFPDYVAFADAVYYARRLYEEMSDKSQATSDMKAALDRYTELLGGYEAIYTPRRDTDVIERWSYGAVLTVSEGSNPAYGAIWEIAVNAKSTGEQSFRFDGLDVSRFGEVVFWVYNPTEYELQLDIHGGWNSWRAYSCKLPGKAWTSVTVNTKVIENDSAGSFFAIISRQGKAAFEGVFGFTALYGVPSVTAARDVIDAIAALPAAADITLADKNDVLRVRAAYEELSRETKSAVTNYSRLTAAENRIAEIEAANFDADVEAFLAVAVTEENAKDLYLRLTDLYNAYDALSDLAAPRVTKLAALDARREELNGHLVNIVNAMIAALPEADTANLPGAIPQISLAQSLYDSLNAEQQKRVSRAEKLQLLGRLCADYRLLFDFIEDNLARVSNTTDFGNAWNGTMTIVADSTYGNLLLMNVLAGHSNSTREAEFRLRETTQRLKKYESLVFYVYAPIEGGALRAWSSDWKNHTDFALQANVWNRVEIDTAMCSDDCLDGLFFTVVAPNGAAPVGEWKISSVYAYCNTEETERLVGDFTRAVDALPDVADLTLADRAAVEAAKAAYDALLSHCTYYFGSSYVRKLNAAKAKIAALEAQTLIDAFEAAVDGLPDAADLTLADADRVAAARAAYHALPADCLVALDKTRVDKLTRCEARIADLRLAGEVADFTRAVGALTNDTTGEELYRVFLTYVALTDAQKAAVTAEKDRLGTLMTGKAAEVTAACVADIAAFDRDHDFPRDAARCALLYDAVLALPDAVFAELSADTKTTVGNLYKEMKKYTVVTNLLTDAAFGEASEDGTYGTVYEMTVKPEGTGTDNILFIMDAGQVGDRRIVFYLFRPEGGADARLYFSGEWRGWGADETSSVTVTSDGWLRVEFSADAVSNGANTSYWYLYLTAATAADGGWRISDIYAV